MNQDKKFHIIAPTIVNNRIAAIKAIRTLTGLGVKEAKDAIEQPGVDQIFSYSVGLTQLIIEEQCQILRNEKFEIGYSVHIILDDLRKLGAQALLQGEDELANDILQLVIVEKLRRKPEFMD